MIHRDNKRAEHSKREREGEREFDTETPERSTKRTGTTHTKETHTERPDKGQKKDRSTRNHSPKQQTTTAPAEGESGWGGG